MLRWRCGMDSVDSQRAIADLSAAFVADLRALPAEAWSGPSDCAGWSVAALFVHVTQVAELLQDSLARGRSSDPGPPARAAAEGVQGWRAWRAGELARRAAQAPAELLDEYQVSAAQLEREFDAIAAAPPAAQAWHPAGPRPLDWFVAQWLFELALHDWDFRVAADPSADLRAGASQPSQGRCRPGSRAASAAPTTPPWRGASGSSWRARRRWSCSPESVTAVSRWRRRTAWLQPTSRS